MGCIGWLVSGQGLAYTPTQQRQTTTHPQLLCPQMGEERKNRQANTRVHLARIFFLRWKDRHTHRRKHIRPLPGRVAFWTSFLCFCVFFCLFVDPFVGRGQRDEHHKVDGWDGLLCFTKECSCTPRQTAWRKNKEEMRSRQRGTE